MDDVDLPFDPTDRERALAGGPLATPDALGEVLARHRRGQGRRFVAGLSVVLVVAAGVGFAVGRSGRISGGVNVDAGAQPTATPAATPTPEPAEASGSGVGFSVSAPATDQVLIRQAVDGTAVRLYLGSLPSPPAAPALAACMPSAVVDDEVSDVKVAGEALEPVFGAAPTSGTSLAVAEIVGGGQPAPILTVVSRAAADVSTVELTTPDGTDKATPSGGWVALAVQLPAGTTDMPTGTIAALSASGSTVGTTPLNQPDDQPFAKCVLAAGGPGCAQVGSGSGSTTTTVQSGTNQVCRRCVVVQSQATGSASSSSSSSGSASDSSSGSASGSGAAPGGPGMPVLKQQICTGMGAKGGSATSSAVFSPAVPVTP